MAKDSIVYYSDFALSCRIGVILGMLCFANKGIPRMFAQDKDLLDLWGDLSKWAGTKIHNGIINGVAIYNVFHGNSQN